MAVDRQLNNTYLGNQNIKRDGVIEEWTKESILEYKKCSEDPIYFIEKYIKIINLDDGLVPFKPYDYQRNMLETFNRERFTLTLCCRQAGKCSHINTIVRLRSKITGEIKEITMGELYESIKANETDLSANDNM